MSRPPAAPGMEPGTETRAGGQRPFASTGPQGHRQRMRERLLAAGADSLADYEVLEMLLFLGIPRRDTKPLAKAMINRFGSLAAVLSAPARALEEVTELPRAAIAALRLPEQAAARLARAETVNRPVLNNWERLGAYLEATRAPGNAPGNAAAGAARRRALFLNNRNQLLADEAQDAAEASLLVRAVIKRAVELHATALIVAQDRAGAKLAPTDADRDLAARLQRAGGVFSIVLHDYLLVGADGWASLRHAGML